jgi:hypothetical protein
MARGSTDADIAETFAKTWRAYRSQAEALKTKKKTRAKKR